MYHRLLVPFEACDPPPSKSMALLLGAIRGFEEHKSMAQPTTRLYDIRFVLPGNMTACSLVPPLPH